MSGSEFERQNIITDALSDVHPRVMRGCLSTLWSSSLLMKVAPLPAVRFFDLPAAMSQGFSANSQYISSRPQATYAKSIAAAPARRTPCDDIDS